MHLISFSSSTMKRVCKAMRSLSPAMPPSMVIVCLRASVLELLGKLPTRGDWEEITRRTMVHVQYTDCRNLSDHLLSPVPKQVEDKRVAVELAGLRQMLWEGDELSHQAFAPHRDIPRPPLDTDASARSRLFHQIYETSPSEWDNHHEHGSCARRCAHSGGRARRAANSS